MLEAQFLQIKKSLFELKEVPSAIEVPKIGKVSFQWITDSDPSKVLEIRNAPHVLEMISTPPLSEDQHKNFLAAYDKLPRMDFIFLNQPVGELIGAVSLVMKNSKIELGKYIGRRNYLGFGIGFLASNQLLEFIAPHIRNETIYIRTKRDNFPNIAVNEKLGFHSPKNVDDFFIEMKKEIV